MPLTNPLNALLEQSPFIVLDGALATELETRGCQITDSLWSANALINQPDIIRQVHLDYFRAGAQCAITASYQASLAGFAQRGLSAERAEALIARSVTLAVEARTEFLLESPASLRPLVAGSVGPYGAYLADGSEYRGDYTLSNKAFIDFHRPRITQLLAAGADLLACETLPSFAEIQALGELLLEFPEATAWFSFTLKDAYHLSDGTPLATVVNFLATQPQVVAIGINCIALADTTSALNHLQALTALPLVVYPNSGETYDAKSKTWHHGGAHCQQLSDYLSDWVAAGAKLIGGCCRTSPKDIQALATQQHALSNE
ncbi:homocysteine S-methyltransferase [Rosenbergiella sp. S61]|uniref:Homocysteine S-methyltransferase n=1 Tax=Rosenbergiella gaditana TaxID=2726987 RepID=A0ABS5SZG0_9GAMM|nr:homocysteine S-methyltransferase [Rosenbergiella gaditana]MBT0724848.1 homocysteine S-methyltransferase [Rosenbergiella gaditana]